MSSESISDHVSPFLFCSCLGCTYSQIYSRDRLHGVFVQLWWLGVHTGSTQGVRHQRASGGLVPKGGVMTGCGLSRQIPEGLDWRFWFKEALDEMHVMLTRLARTTTRMRAIGLVMPSVMLYPYRCSWMRSTFVHHSYLSKVYPLYAINASCQDRPVRLDGKPQIVHCRSTD